MPPREIELLLQALSEYHEEEKRQLDKIKGTSSKSSFRVDTIGGM